MLGRFALVLALMGSAVAHAREKLAPLFDEESKGVQRSMLYNGRAYYTHEAAPSVVYLDHVASSGLSATPAPGPDAHLTIITRGNVDGPGQAEHVCRLCALSNFLPQFVCC